VELEAYNRAERKSYARPTTTEPSSETNALLKTLSTKFDSLQSEVRDLQVKSQNRKQKTQEQRTCFYCNKPGHVQRHCFARKA
jgi:Tfp pilus assembly protein PilN